MAARAVASGIIEILHVPVPVKYYIAASSEDKSLFKMITPSGNTVNMVFCDSVTGDQVKKDECDKGYEVRKGEFVTFTQDELKQLESERTNNVVIEEFVPLDSIDMLSVEKSYYVKPDKGGDRGYKLLSQALKNKNYAAVGKFMARGKDQLVILREYKGGVVMHQMYYADEVRDFSTDNISVGREISPLEAEMFGKLLEVMAKETFQPTKYTNQWYERVREAAEAKAAGTTVTVKTAKFSGTMDLLAALQASIAASESKK